MVQKQSLSEYYIIKHSPEKQLVAKIDNNLHSASKPPK